MGYRRYDRRKQIILIYTLRTAVVLLAAGAITLMVLGGVYLFNLFRSDEKSQVAIGDQPVYLESNGIDDLDTESENHKQDASVQFSDKNNLSEDSKASEDISTTPDSNHMNESTTAENTLSVVLDAGHGGNDGGTFNGDIIEKHITLAVVEKMQDKLELEGVDVILTRETDKYLSLEDRTKIANESQADLFVSIHCNYYEDDDSVSGLECHYCEGSDVGEEYAEEMTDALEENDDIKVREIKESDYFVLKFTDIPAILVEMGFLSNPAECEKLASEAYQEVLAEELVKSILDAVDAL